MTADLPERGRAVAPACTPACTLGDERFAERYAAIDARDTRFDGQFVTAVTSTGIYCRPSCPARTPRPENVVFYGTSAAAHDAGFRACRRCLPEATPGTPEWDLRGDVAGRAMRLIADGVVDRDGVDGLAARLGYTPRHVHRLLVAELGAGPAALARAQRAQTARSLLVGTDLRHAEVDFAAGFGSVRQFNETVQRVFAAQPGELRQRARRAARASRPGPAGPLAPPGAPARGAPTGTLAPVRLDVDLPVRQPVDVPGMHAFLAARAVAGVEVAETRADGSLRYARTLLLPHGPGAVEVVAAQPRTGGWTLRATLELTALDDVAPAVARVRRMLDLDADPAAVDAALSADPALRSSVLARPGTRVPGAVDPHELVVRAVVGQQISVAAARTHLGRLASQVGTPYLSAVPGLDRLFPTAAEIAETVPVPGPDEALDPDRVLRLPRRSVRTVVETARALADGSLDVHVGADAVALREALLARPGIGPWTAAYVVMRVLGDPDAWLPGDVALVAGARALGLLGADGAIPSDTSMPTAHRDLAEQATGWAPWRSYAVVHLWRAASAASNPASTRAVSPR